MSVNFRSVQGPARDLPDWRRRARIRRTDPQGLVVADEYACNGEYVRVSPHYRKTGRTYRVRPENAPAFFAAMLHEAGLLPELFTAQDCADEEVLSLLDTLWPDSQHLLPSLESPVAASDHGTEPSPRAGFSFTIAQALVEFVGLAASGPAASTAPAADPARMDALRRKVEEIRAKQRQAAVVPKAASTAKSGRRKSA